jgi:uncharacterized membrane protein YhaH (DUF805 family)/ribosomal protein L40E
MTCSKCGVENAPLSGTCRRCGAVLASNSTVARGPAGTRATQSNNESAIGWYLTALKKYAVFTGRARRKEFWYFFLFNNLILIALAILGSLFRSANGPSPFGVLSAIYAVATVVPALAVSVRRLHDINLSGWLCLLVLVPLVGGIILLILCAQDSKGGQNQHGPDPKAETSPPMPKPAPAADIVPGALSTLAVAPEPQPKPAPMVFCTKCGTKNPADAQYCYSCGSLIFKPQQAGAGDGKLMGPTAPHADHPTVPEDQSGTPGDESTAAAGAKQGYPELTAEDKRVDAFIGVGVAVVVIGLLCVLLLWVVRPKSGPSSAGNRENPFEKGLKEYDSGHSSAGTGENTVGAQVSIFDQPLRQINREASGISQTRNGGSSPRSTHGARTDSTAKAAPVHTLIDAQACTAFVQSSMQPERISNLSGLKIERLAVYKADGYGDIGWDVGYDIVNRTAVRGSQNSFPGYCVSGIMVDFKLRDSESGETWHERDDTGLDPTETVNSESHNVKEYTSEPPVVLKATIVSAVGMPVETANGLSSSQPSSGTIGNSK